MTIVVVVVVVDGHEAVDNVNGDRKDDGGVILSRNTVQSLQISQLQKCYEILF